MSITPSTRLPRFVTALVISILLNLGMVIGLGQLHAEDINKRDEKRLIVPMTIVDTPPPPPPKSQEVDEPTTNIEASLNTLPPLELPAANSSIGAIEVPKADGDQFGWSLEVSMPNFAGRGDKALSKDKWSVANPPILLYQPDLAMFYPGRARRAQITGKTKLVLKLDSKGQIESIQIKSSTPEGVFERAARRAAKKLRYKPSVRNGRPQSSTVSMEFIWKLD